MITFPPCPHAGNQLTGRRFCRHSERPELVALDICNGCLHAEPQEPAALQPVCHHRGQQLRSIVSCGCPQSFQKGVFDCALHGDCVCSKHNRENVPGVRCCETCGERQERPETQILGSVDELAIIAVHYNPQRYCLPIRNYWEWRHHLGRLQQNLITVELSFDGHFSIHDSVKILGADRNLMWQKEAMINHAIRNLPEQYRYVAWIDHDMIFPTTWATRVLEMLSSDHATVQLYESIQYQGVDRRTIHQQAGAVANFQKGTSGGCPGGAWAARRDYLESCGGLPVTMITGGGDVPAAHGFAGIKSDYYYKTVSAELRQDNLLWVERAQQVRGNLKSGYLPITLNHLYHGTRKNRRYADRTKMLANFNPQADIRLNHDGILEWCSDKLRLHAEVADYFESRREDE